MRAGEPSPRAICRACVALAMSNASKLPLVTSPFARVVERPRFGMVVALVPRVFFAMVPHYRILGLRRRRWIREAGAALDVADERGERLASRSTDVVRDCLVVGQEKPHLSAAVGVVEIDDPCSTRFATTTQPNANLARTTRRRDCYTSARIGDDCNLRRSELIIRKESG